MILNLCDTKYEDIREQHAILDVMNQLKAIDNNPNITIVCMDWIDLSNFKIEWKEIKVNFISR